MSLLDRISSNTFERLDFVVSLSVRAIGPAFIAVFYGLVSYFTFYYFKIMAGWMYLAFPLPISFIYHMLIWYTFISLCFNHIMAWIVHPGNIRGLRQDIKMMKEKGIWGKYNSNNVLLRKHFKNKEPSLEMSGLMKFRLEDINENSYFWINQSQQSGYTESIHSATGYESI